MCQKKMKFKDELKDMQLSDLHAECHILTDAVDILKTNFDDVVAEIESRTEENKEVDDLEQQWTGSYKSINTHRRNSNGIT